MGWQSGRVGAHHCHVRSHPSHAMQLKVASFRNGSAQQSLRHSMKGCRKTTSESWLSQDSITGKCPDFSAAMGTGASVEQRFRKPNARRVNLFNILTEIMKETKREEEIPEDHWELLMKALETEEQAEAKQLKEELEKERASRVAQEQLVEKLKAELKLSS